MSDTNHLANQRAVAQLCASRPVLTGFPIAGEALELPREVILASGPTLPFEQYTGGQRAGIVGAVLYEGLADTPEAAEAALVAGKVQVRGCQEFNCVGSLAGVTSASMPVAAVRDDTTNLNGFCTLYEGDSADRLNYGAYSAATRANLDQLRDRVAPALQCLLDRAGGAVELTPLMARALTMGDELHSRNTAATLLFLRELLIRGKGTSQDLDTTLEAALQSLGDDYFFLRISMAASKVLARSMHGIEGSSIVTAMAFSCREFGIQVSGLGDRWFTGPLPTFEALRLEDGFSTADLEFMGGESVITEVVGLGGMAQAAGLPLFRSSGRSAATMVGRTEAMYAITHAEHPTFRIPSLNYRGTPLGIDVLSVAHTGTTPYLDIGAAGRSRRQIGGGVARAPLEPFLRAEAALRDAHPDWPNPQTASSRPLVQQSATPRGPIH